MMSHKLIKLTHGPETFKRYEYGPWRISGHTSGNGWSGRSARWTASHKIKQKVIRRKTLRDLKQAIQEYEQS